MQSICNLSSLLVLVLVLYQETVLVSNGGQFMLVPVMRSWVPGSVQ